MSSISSVYNSHFGTESIFTRYALRAIGSIFTIFDYSRSSGTTRLSNGNSVLAITVYNSHFGTKTRGAFIAFIAFIACIAFIAFIAFSTGFTISTVFTVFDNYRSSGTIRLSDSERMTAITVCNRNFRAVSVFKFQVFHQGIPCTTKIISVHFFAVFPT